MMERNASTRSNFSKYFHFLLVAGLLIGLCLFAVDIWHGSFIHPLSVDIERLPNQDRALKLNTVFSGTLGLSRSVIYQDYIQRSVLPNITHVNRWEPLANGGLNHYVNALTVMGNDLYVGGSFGGTADGSTTRSYQIILYSNGVWSALPNWGLSGRYVKALAVMGSDLYVGGDPWGTGDSSVTNLGNIAKYSNGAWSALPNWGLNGPVEALAVIGNDLYVGGQFQSTNDGSITNLGYIARYSNGTWFALPNQGFDRRVTALAVIGNDLYVGGDFSRTRDNAITNLGHIARYSNGAWSALPNQGLDRSVDALAVMGNDLYAGGLFHETEDGSIGNLGHIARYSNGAWSALPNQGLIRPDYILSDDVSALAVMGNDLYVGGEFSQTGDGTITNLGNIVKYSNGAWSALPNQGLNNVVNALAVKDNDLYAAGLFNKTGDSSIANLGYVAVLKTESVPTPTPSPVDPVIFIPGISGSYLASGTEELWPAVGFKRDEKHQRLTLDPSKIQDNVIATDILRKLFVKDIYQSFIDALIADGFVEYQVNSEPVRRTEVGCDKSQAAQNPTLFVFAYDWRQDNAVNADKLAEYVKCIRQFYPNNKINIIAHSMGGLIARRYILDYPGTHSVHKLITIGTPWLGAPKAVMAIETGEEFAPIFAVTPSVLQELLLFFPGAHQLIPSRSYFELNGKPLSVDQQDYSFEQMKDLLDRQFVSHPGTATDNFHTFIQDDWRDDTTGVVYYIIFGLEKENNTIEQVVAATTEIICPSNSVVDPCFSVYDYQVVWGKGDETVPRLSAERIGEGPNGIYISLNGAAILYNPRSGDQTHSGLMKNQEVQDYILGVLDDKDGVKAMMSAHAVQEFPVESAYYIRASGIEKPIVVDEQGNSTKSDMLFLDEVPGVQIAILGKSSYALVLSKDKSYTVTITTPGNPVKLEIKDGTDVTSTRAIRYLDLVLPAHANTSLKLTPQGIEPLYVDSDRNGSLDTMIKPTVDVSGTLAMDKTPPVVNITHIQDDKNITVTINAVDAETGVANIRYSLDGSHFQYYSKPFTVEVGKIKSIYAFADDKVANRSRAAIYTLPQTLYLPMIHR